MRSAHYECDSQVTNSEDAMTREAGDRLIPLREVCDWIGASKTEIYRRIAAGTFPLGIRIGESTVRWREADVARWVSEASDAAPRFYRKIEP